MAHYLITGVAGFIGSNLAEALLAAGETVRGLDDFSTGRKQNLAGLDGLEFVEGDIRDLEVCRAACGGGTVRRLGPRGRRGSGHRRRCRK